MFAQTQPPQPSTKAVITLYRWHFTNTHLTPYPTPQPSHAVGVLRGAQGWMYLNQKATGSCSELQSKSGSCSAVCPLLQAASLLILTQKVLQVHRQPFVYQMSHGPQNHRTYHHTLLQAAQYPLTSVWGLLAASTDWSCHWHAGLCRKFPNAVNTNTVRGQRGETRPEKPRGWWCPGAIHSSLRETGDQDDYLVRAALPWAVTGIIDKPSESRLGLFRASYFMRV